MPSLPLSDPYPYDAMQPKIHDTVQILLAHFWVKYLWQSTLTCHFLLQRLFIFCLTCCFKKVEIYINSRNRFLYNLVTCWTTELVAWISILWVYARPLFVNSNRGAPKGRWRGNKWRIFSLLNGALEGLWLGVVGYKTELFGCIHVLVHRLNGWQLCC